MIQKKLNIKLDEYGRGGHAIVVFDRDLNRAIKIFKSYQHPDCEKSDYTEEVFNDYKRKIFQSELAAYELISDKSIQKYFPNHYKN